MLFWNKGNSVSISKLHLKSPYYTALLIIVFLCLLECVVRVACRGLVVACRDLPISCFLSNLLGLAILTKLNTETCVFRYKFGNVTFILKSMGRYRC